MVRWSSDRVPARTLAARREGTVPAYGDSCGLGPRELIRPPRAARRATERSKSVRMMSLVARAVGAVVFGMATATLAVAGAWAPLDDHPTVAGLLGAVVALGTAGPFLARTFSERTRLLTLSAQELARHFTDRIRETLVTSGAGLTLEDVGVHFCALLPQAATAARLLAARVHPIRPLRQAQSPAGSTTRDVAGGLAYGSSGRARRHRRREARATASGPDGRGPSSCRRTDMDRLVPRS